MDVRVCECCRVSRRQCPTVSQHQALQVPPVVTVFLNTSGSGGYRDALLMPFLWTVRCPPEDTGWYFSQAVLVRCVFQHINFNRVVGNHKRA